ncbi:hypothetical protein D9757_015491 [Collybiopsis confluens]|uniref:Uncharacterized protein n=1 Tax=Collybiopsis confluens TaxID=2823264 RepID=A0A8H5BZ95_9AGAR|nr:hypothetical protein D9757_015491 [Collybiopsis confluens]
MIVLVNYDVINVQPGVEWLEYDQVRNAKTLRYLHDASRSGLDFYYHFKDGYFPPAYTAYEKQIMKKI